VVARRHQGQGGVAALTVLLAATLLRRRPVPRFAGKDAALDQAVTCPDDGHVLERNKDGTYNCPKCGGFFEHPPQKSSS
jgi:hypothetical protein